MKILIAGGTGFIGTALIKSLLSHGHSVVVMTRQSLKPSEHNLAYLHWNGKEISESPLLENTEVVVNLSGRSLGDSRWTPAVKKSLLSSRTLPVQAIVRAIGRAYITPQLLVSASAVGYYGPHEEAELNETDPPGMDFLAYICKDWEAEALRAEEYGVKVCLTRTGMVLGKEGALPKMMVPFKYYLGNIAGTGKQFISWIHILDAAEAIRFIIEKKINGPVNLVAPEPLSNRDFNKKLGRIMKKPCWLRVPSFALKLVLGDQSDLLLKGQRVFPSVLNDNKFRFQFETLEAALSDIINCPVPSNDIQTGSK
jgi:uncharacterized protein